MKQGTRRGLHLVGAIAILVAGIVAPSSGTPVSPWENPNQPIQTRYWGYNFDDGIVFPPTVTEEDGNWDPGSDPVFGMFGTGDIPSVFNNLSYPVLGMGIGVADASQDSQFNISLDVPNEPHPDRVKYFWFAFDYLGTGEIPVVTAGTDNIGYSVSPIQGFDQYHHIEGYVTITPQPEDEWLQIQCTMDQGEYMWIDNLKVGSQCIPEPAALGLLGLISGCIYFTRRFFLV